MKLKDVKINFMNLGVTRPDKPRRKVAMCYAEITSINNEKITKEITVVPKKEYRGRLICEDFIVTTAQLNMQMNYIICNDKGEVIKYLPTTIGEPIACNPNHFICRKGNIIIGINKLGESIGSRELTEDEIQNI